MGARDAANDGVRAGGADNVSGERVADRWGNFAKPGPNCAQAPYFSNTILRLASKGSLLSAGVASNR